MEGAGENNLSSLSLQQKRQANSSFLFQWREEKFCFLFFAELKKYYNSKLIEQLADNIKTKFIWFLWRKQVVRLVWVEEMKWIIDEFMNQLWMKWNPLKQRRPPIQFLFFFPFSLFENERDEEKKRIDGQLAAGERARQLSFFLVGYRRRKPQATSQEKRRAASGGANQQNHSIWEGMNKLIVFVVAWRVGWFGLFIFGWIMGWRASQCSAQRRQHNTKPTKQFMKSEENETKGKERMEWKEC